MLVLKELLFDSLRALFFGSAVTVDGIFFLIICLYLKETCGKSVLKIPRSR